MVDEIRELGRRILKRAGKMPLQVFIRVKKGVLARFTNNGIHQNTFQDLCSYTLRLLAKEGTVWVESNDLSDEGIRKALQKVRAACPHPEPIPATRRRSYFVTFQPVIASEAKQSRSGIASVATLPRNDERSERLRYFKVKEHFPFKAEKTPEMAAWAIEEGVRLIRSEQASANGYYSAFERFFYLADSEGLELFHPATAVRFGVTITKGAGKGYFSFYHPDPRKLKVRPVVEEAIRLAEEASQAEIKAPPGEYECILSPRAFLELIEPLRRHFDARFCEDRKSVLSGLLGKKIFSEKFTLYDGIGQEGPFGLPFDAEGASKRKVTLVKQGVLKELLAEGHSTRGIAEHPFYPQNLVVEKGDLSLSELFRRVRRGIFINKIWYHTLVREAPMEVTGLATAGSVYVERGRVQGRVVRLRYHDSILSILRSVIGATKERILLKDGEMGSALLPYLWVSRLRVVDGRQA